ncbi:MAG: methyltransferase domain-containing protein [Marivibrio sp.]|uniref:class I SAM-dependent methyltransferase n=1 Tax=Marivibrio sp. TaxID=2039719 RepID=UPI0032EFDD85
MSDVRRFYDKHPINLAQIQRDMRETLGGDEDWTPDQLCRFDNDHYGGVHAVDALIEAAGLGPQDRVLDIGCGVGGPLRRVAHRTGCRGVGLDLTPSRIDAARRLTAAVGLQDRLTFVEGDAVDSPLPDAQFTAVIGQEAWCHIPDKAALLREAHRMLEPDGRIAFTDIVTRDDLRENVRARLREEMCLNALASRADYERYLAEAGFEPILVEDLSAAWTELLRVRLKMYEGLAERDDGGVADHGRYLPAYRFFVGLFVDGALGGVRIAATRRP